MPVKVPIPYIPAVKIEQTVRIILVAPIEDLQSTPTPLPTSEPQTSQWTKSLSSTDLPTIIPSTNYVRYVALVFLAGKNTDAASQTVYWRMIKNGSSVASGSSSVASNNYYTVNARFYDVYPTDVIEVRLWATSSNVNWDYSAFQIHPTRFATNESFNSHCYTEFLELILQPVLTKGTPGVGYTQPFYVCSMDYNITSVSSTSVFECLFPKIVNRIFKIHYGDYISQNSASVHTSSTSRPYYTQNYLPTEIYLKVFKTW